MKESLYRNWKRTPSHIRRPVVLVIGLFVVILSGAIGWLPGPGGIPLFLIGVAILATEFHWAYRLKMFILSLVYTFGKWLRANKVKGAFVLLLSAMISITILYMLLYRR